MQNITLNLHMYDHVFLFHNGAMLKKKKVRVTKLITH